MAKTHISIEAAAVLLGVTEEEARSMGGLSKITCSIPAVIEERMVLEEVLDRITAKSRGSLQEKLRSVGVALGEPYRFDRNTHKREGAQ